MHSIVSDCIIIPGLPPLVQECHKFIKVSLPLVSVGKLCINGIIVVFNDSTVTVMTKSGRTILQGKRDPFHNLYMMPVSQATCSPPKVGPPLLPPTCLFPEPPSLIHQRATSAYELRTVPALISYLHVCASFLPKDTFIDAINAGFYSSWPGLSAPRVRKHLKKSKSTTSGHMKLIRHGIRPYNKKCTKKHSVGVMLLDPNNKDDLKNLIAKDLRVVSPSRRLVVINTFLLC